MLLDTGEIVNRRMNLLFKYKIEILLLIAVIFSVHSYFYTSESGMWFSRSGSIMVLLAAIAEFQINTAKEASIETSSTVTIGGGNALIKRELSPRYRTLSVIAHFEVIIGTVIWGYGDCVFKLCT